MSSLVPCPGCQRHLRVAEVACPFCGADVSRQLAPRARPAVSTAGLSRAAVLAIGAGLATAAVGLLPGCEDDAEPVPSEQPVYGAPVQNDGGNDAGSADAGDAGRLPSQDGGQAIAVYGAPVVPMKDAGAADGSVSDAAVYGAPVVPPLDAGATDAGAGDAGHSGDAGADAGTDAGADAGRTDGGRAVPVYGAPVSS
jgi:hypothetical protein